VLKSENPYPFAVHPWRAGTPFLPTDSQKLWQIANYIYNKFICLKFQYRLPDSKQICNPGRSTLNVSLLHINFALHQFVPVAMVLQFRDGILIFMEHQWHWIVSTLFQPQLWQLFGKHYVVLSWPWDKQVNCNSLGLDCYMNCYGMNKMKRI
jgi:hypothetical protein